MAKATLATNFKDDILNSSMGSKRRYNLIQNSDGTVSLEDVSTYNQVGSEYGASQVNATNNAVNASADAGKIIDDVDDINAVTKEGYIAGALALKEVNSSLNGLSFVQDEDGNWGYKVGADAVVPFKSGDKMHYRASCLGSDVKNFNEDIITPYKVTCGFKPSLVVVFGQVRLVITVYNRSNLSDEMLCVYVNQQPHLNRINTANTDFQLYIDDDGIRFGTAFCYASDVFYIDLYE